ncbi:hypothetical protein MATL_G00069410 [Megalops atlanticus]|uniref:Uncharacterized protein n=1 Tax=Megalops atlanticus TaxID=7932 RepID=A0A9D3T802_MEGAT|nr:hypothetical protein MATL_G00069410 [Megalops atlanticus]
MLFCPSLPPTGRDSIPRFRPLLTESFNKKRAILGVIVIFKDIKIKDSLPELLTGLLKMHSGSLDKAGTPRKRTLSRGMSEDESLRHLIKEAEGSTRRTPRADGKTGSIKRQERGVGQPEEDLITKCPEMLDLQESYDEAMQELRGLELQREALLFQVDCLQDALEGAEEMLAETRREADDANTELERERYAKRKLEEMVGSLMEEVQRLKEERAAIPVVPVYTIVRRNSVLEGEELEGAGTMEADAKGGARPHEEVELASDALTEAEGSIPGAPLTVVRLDSTPSTLGPPPTGPQKGGSSPDTTTATSGGILASLFRRGKEAEQQPTGGGEGGGGSRPPLQRAALGSSVDSEDALDSGERAGETGGDGPLAKFQRMINKTFAQAPSLAVTTELAQDGMLRGDLSPDSEAAGAGPLSKPPSGEAPSDPGELTVRPPPSEDSPAAGPSLPEAPAREEQLTLEGEDTTTQDGELASRKDGSEAGTPKSPDSCILS